MGRDDGGLRPDRVAAENRKGEGEQAMQQPGDTTEHGDREDDGAPAPRPPLSDRLPLDSRGRAPRSGYDADGRLRDRLGRVIPSRLNWLKLIRAVPQFVVGPDRAFCREVPGEFFAKEIDEDRTPVAVVACPCGKEPRVSLTSCLECECERFYLNLGERVLVANSPQDRAGDTEYDDAPGSRSDAEPPTSVVD